jgi:predicted AlkP superfamily pyrophosphatase or phosphodiesterase
MRADPNWKNQSQAKQRRWLIGWFWTWPLLSTLVLSIHWHNPTILRHCAPALFLPGLIGTSASAWAIARTKDRVYGLPCIASVILLALGAWQFWMVAP